MLLPGSGETDCRVKYRMGYLHGILTRGAPEKEGSGFKICFTKYYETTVMSFFPAQRTQKLMYTFHSNTRSISDNAISHLIYLQYFSF